MNINHYYLYRLSQERMRKFLDAEEQHRMVKFVYPMEDKPHWMTMIMKKIKGLILHLFNLQDRPSVSNISRTGSFPEGSST